MQVTYGQPLFESDPLAHEGRAYFDQPGELIAVKQLPQLGIRFNHDYVFSDADDSKPAADVVSAPLPVRVKRRDCVNSLQLRGELLRLSSFLQRVVPSRVVVHNDPVSARLQRRLDDGVENKAFVAFDVEHLINQWGHFNALFPDVCPTVRANAGNRHVLAALVHSLGIRVNVASPADVALLSACVEDVTSADACNQYAQSSRADFTAACGMDSAIVRSPSAIRRALSCGVTLMSVGSLSGIRTIRSAVQSAPRDLRRSLAVPGLVLSIRSSSAAQCTGPLSAGSSILRCDVASFSPRDATAAIKLANSVNLAVVGVHGDIGTLLDGTIQLVAAQIVASRQTSRSKDVLTIVLDGLDNCLSEDCDTALPQIQVAIASIRALLGSASLTVHADISEHLLGSNQVLFTRVIGARPSIGGDGAVVGRQLYVDDGIYGSLCTRTKLTATPAFTVGYDEDCLKTHFVGRGRPSSIPEDQMYEDLPCTIWGQTCDSLDKVMTTAAGQMPGAVGLGDWLSFSIPMCAGNAMNTGFNGYDAPLTRFMVHTGFE